MDTPFLMLPTIRPQGKYHPQMQYSGTYKVAATRELEQCKSCGHGKRNFSSGAVSMSINHFQEKGMFTGYTGSW